MGAQVVLLPPGPERVAGVGDQAEQAAGLGVHDRVGGGGEEHQRPRQAGLTAGGTGHAELAGGRGR